MDAGEHTFPLRVRYSETDQMGTFYNARALEWFEVGRTEYLRAIGLPYTQFEAQGLMLPLTEAHLEFLGRARYDDELRLTVSARWAGRVRLRFDVKIVQMRDGAAVVRGHTVHALVDPAARPLRPPAWLLAKLPQEPTRMGRSAACRIWEPEISGPQGSLGIICRESAAGVARRAARSARLLVLEGAQQPPLEQIRAFVAGVDRCVVVEAGDGALARQLRAAGIAVEGTPDGHCVEELSVDGVRGILAQDDPGPP